MDCLGERKKEYTIQLVNILSPIIYTGIHSLYTTAIEYSKDGVLNQYRYFLKMIPTWQPELVDTEVKRIITESPIGDQIKDLFCVVITTNIMILTGTTHEKRGKIKCPDNITFEKFIHEVYINLVDFFFINAFLFHNETPISDVQVCKNKKDSMDIIEKTVEKTIRKLLPLSFALEKYLGPDTEVNRPDTKQVEVKQNGGNNEDSDNNSDNIVNNNSIQEIRSVHQASAHHSVQASVQQSMRQVSEHQASEHQQLMQQASEHQASVQQEPIKQTNTSEKTSIKHRQKNQMFDVSNIQDPEESAAYYKGSNKHIIDNFSNAKYSQQNSTNIDTQEIKKYAMAPSRHATDNSSIRNYVPKNKINAVKF